MPSEHEVLQHGRAVTDAGFFVLRTPALPADDFFNWTSELAQSRLDIESASSEIELAWHQDVRVLRERLTSLLDRPEITRALLIASPTLQAGIRHWKSNPDSKKGLQAERTLVRYFTRMCTRPTPFGLFAGCTLGLIGKSGTESSLLNLQARHSYRTKTRLDYDYLFELADALTKDRRILRELQFWPNSSLHRCGSYWHYVEATPIGDGSARSHQLVKVQSSTYLEAVVGVCSRPEGASFHEIVNTLISDKSMPRTNAESYAQQAVENQIVLPALSPLVTGDSPLADIISQLRLIPSAADVVSKLSDVEKQLAVMDGLAIDAPVDEYRREHHEGLRLLESLPAAVRPGFVYQVDMTKPSDQVILTERIMSAIREAIDAACRLAVIREPQVLTDFRKAFIERYERNPAPLLQVLDEESGIGFGPPSACQSTAVRGLPLADVPSPGLESLGLTHKFLLDRITKCFRDGSRELQLDLSEIPVFDGQPLALPTSLCVNAELAASSHSALRSGDFKILLNAIGGPAGVRTVARFCHAEPRLTTKVREYLQTEQSYEPDAILAEVVYLPEGRFGNVLSRPVLREHEIVYLGRSGAAQHRQLPASDLLVTVNEREEICLLSQKLGRRVIPRVSSAQNFFGLFHAPVYRFLSYLQFQNGFGSLTFSWGPLDFLSYLPRVSVGRVVLAVAQWRLRENEISELAESVGPQRFANVRKLRSNLSLPRFLKLVQPNEQLLLVDLDNALSVDAFVHTLAREREATLYEVFPSREELCVTSEEGRFWHELDVPLINHVVSEPARKLVSNSSHVTIHSTRRADRHSFAPGGEWLYLKLYGGWSTLDQILTSHLRPLVSKLIRDSLVLRWFFIRYADPRGHLRLRFHGDPATLHREVLPLLTGTFKPLVDSNIIWKLQFDTYVRETQRYGGPEGILASENIFQADSDCVLELLSALQSTDDLDMRWRVALLGIDSFLADCGLDVDQKVALIEALLHSCYPERQVAETGKSQLIKTARRILGDRFRKERAWFEGIRANYGTEEGVWDVFKNAFRARAVVIADTVVRLNRLRSSGQLSRPISALVSSYLHMYVNRMMRSAAREHEFVLYDFLFRLYGGEAARARPGTEVASILGRKISGYE